MRLHVYLPDELVAKVDASRGDVPRSKFVQRALEAALSEGTGAPAVASPRVSANFGAIGPRRPRGETFKP